jgi:hypothetical protein
LFGSLWLYDGNFNATLLQCRKGVWWDAAVGYYLVNVIYATYTAETASAELRGVAQHDGLLS